jgi:uncharacterized protein (TIGR03437 family)
VLPAASGASLLCTPAAAPSLLRAEGLAEPLGDIVLSCTGAPGPVSMSLGVLLSVPVTNRAAAGGAIDVALTVDTPSGPVPAGAGATLTGISSVSLGGIHFTVPESGAVTLRISNLRAAVAQQGISNETPIQALLTVAGDVLLTNTVLSVGIPQRSLLSTGNSSTVNCYGSPSPTGAITMASLFSAGARIASTRVTEGFLDAFDKRGAGADSGVRIVVRYSGFPEGARIFVPDAIAGSDAVQPTSGGDLTATVSAGVYDPDSRPLLLVRVAGADASGAGGTLAYTPGAPGSGPVLLDGATEIALTGGSGEAVYEVVNANPMVRESAEIPTFFALPPAGGAVAPAGRQSVSLGPVSEIATATAADPVPRFVQATPPPDCSVIGDCDVFPKLAVNAPPLIFTAESGGPPVGAYIPVGNVGGGALAWDVRATYENGSDWMRWAVNPVLPYSWGAVALTISPAGLAPGVYKGTLIIDAGLTAGSQLLPVTLTVVPPSQPYVTGITDAATFGTGPFAPGSLVTVWGVKLSKATVSVLFDGIAAKQLYSGDRQINLQVPPELAGRASANMVVTVDGQSTKPRMVDLAPVAPAIFANGILNQDWSVNSATNAASAGSIVSIWATGLAAAERSTISVRLGDRDIASLEYAGPAPTLAGVDQVNLRIPADLAPATADLQLCAVNPWTSQRVCSPAAKITTR